jgi:hypothetical protein
MIDFALSVAAGVCTFLGLQDLEGALAKLVWITLAVFGCFNNSRSNHLAHNGWRAWFDMKHTDDLLEGTTHCLNLLFVEPFAVEKWTDGH